MLKRVCMISSLSRAVGLAMVGLCWSGPVWAESLEERVSQLEKQQERQSNALELVSEMAGKVEVSGFVSIRGGQIDSEETSYVTTLTDEWTFSEESVFGLQFNSTLSESMSASLQLKASGLRDGVEFEWAYLEYAFQPDLKLRAGRLRAPGYMLSEYLDVGYAYPWAQVPYEVYGWLPFNRYEGLDLRHWFSVGDADLRVTAYAGTSSDQKLRLGNFEYTDQTSRFAGLEVQMTYDIYTFRAGYSRYRFELTGSALDVYLLPLVNGVTIVPGIEPYVGEVKVPGLIDYADDVMSGDGVTPGSGFLTDMILLFSGDADPANDALIPVLENERSALAAQLQPYQQIPSMNEDTYGEFFGLGFSADNGEYLIMAELTSSYIEGVFPDVEGGYVLVGYRFGNWMPYVNVATVYTVGNNDFPALVPIQGNPVIEAAIPGYGQLVEGANLFTGGLIAAMNALRLEQDTYTLGVRWDPAVSLAIKAEMFYANMSDGSYGFALPKQLLELAAGNSSGRSVDEITISSPEENVTGVRLSIDMVF